MTEQRKRPRWGMIESILVVVWFVVFVAFQMGFRNQGFLDALSALLGPLNIVLSVLVIFGILGVAGFVSGLRGK